MQYSNTARDSSQQLFEIFSNRARRFICSLEVAHSIMRAPIANPLEKFKRSGTSTKKTLLKKPLVLRSVIYRLEARPRHAQLVDTVNTYSLPVPHTLKTTTARDIE